MKYFRPKEPRIIFTKDGFDKVLEEKKKLWAERPDAVDHLRKAREMGDLSENGYYKAARARLSFIDAQIRRVERLIRLGQIVERTNTDFVDVGTKVTVSEGNQSFTYTIVGGYESDPEKQTISFQSPLGRSLMGKKINQLVEFTTPKGVRKLTITNIL